MQTRTYYQPQPPVKTTIDATGSTWAALLHVSQLAHGIVPMAGIVAPIIIWQLKKGEYPELDEHGKMVCNWMVSQFLYSAIFGILAFFLIGIPFLFALAIVSIVFPIIGAVKAFDGKFWKYPMTIRFFR
jgi:uncharacterized Tic20 family protein